MKEGQAEEPCADRPSTQALEASHHTCREQQLPIANRSRPGRVGRLEQQPSSTSLPCALTGPISKGVQAQGVGAKTVLLHQPFMNTSTVENQVQLGCRESSAGNALPHASLKTWVWFLELTMEAGHAP